MSFRVKEYYSKWVLLPFVSRAQATNGDFCTAPLIRIEWRIGKGGFGSVYLGYKSPGEGDETPAGARTPTSATSSRSGCDCCVHSSQEQVAIKLEKIGTDQAFLADEARTLKAIQGGPGIPDFFLFSRTAVSTPATPPTTLSIPKELSPANARPWQPRQFPPMSPLSPPGHSPKHGPRPYVAHVAQVGATPFKPFPNGEPPQTPFPTSPMSPMFPFVPSSVPRPSTPASSPSAGTLDANVVARIEPYYALVMERLGENLETTFRKHRKTGSVRNHRFDLRVQELPASTFRAPESISPASNSRPVGVDPRLCRSAPGSPVLPKKELKRIRLLREEQVANQNVQRLGWTPKTLCWIGSSVLKSLEHVHACGFVHRDIKPENLCVGRGVKSDEVFLVDFGMALRYRTADGMHKAKNEQSRGCIGTQSFMSYKCSGSRRDDIESLAYVLLYLYKGTLPWARQVDKFEQSFAKSGQRWTAESIQFNSDIQTGKEKLLTTGEGLKEYPRELRAFVLYAGTLQYADRPDYHYLRTILDDLRRRHEPIVPSPPATPAPKEHISRKCKTRRPPLRAVKTSA